MPIGSMLLGDVLDSAYTPQVDATHYKDGQFYKDDGQGNMVPTTLYKAPNMFQRIVSPEARQYAGLNAQATASPLLAQQQSLNQGLASRNTAETLDPSLTDTSYAGLYDPRFTQSARNTQGAATQFANVGGPAVVGNTELNEAQARQQIASNAAKEAAVSGLIGNPTQRPLVENQGLNLQSGQLAGEQALLPSRQYNAGLQTGNDTLGLLGQRATLPITNETGYNQALLGRLGSQEQLAETPYTIPGMRANAITQSYEAQNPAGIHPSVFNAHVNPAEGTITPGRTPLAEQMTSSMVGMNSAPITGPNGMSLVLPPKNPAINPAKTSGMNVPSLIGDRPMINGQPDEAQQDIIDRHNKAAKATHDSMQADKDVEIAQLQAEKKRLAAEHLNTGLLPTLGRLRPTDFMTEQGKQLIGNAGDWLSRKLWSGE